MENMGYLFSTEFLLSGVPITKIRLILKVIHFSWCAGVTNWLPEDRFFGHQEFGARSWGPQATHHTSEHRGFEGTVNSSLVHENCL